MVVEGLMVERLKEITLSWFIGGQENENVYDSVEATMSELHIVQQSQHYKAQYKTKSW